MNTQEKLDLAQWAVEKAQSSGANQASASVVTNRSVTVEYRDGTLETLTDSAERAVSVALYVDGRYSSQSTNDVSRDSLVGFIDQAVKMTRHLGEDLDRTLADPERYKGRKEVDLGIYDDSHGDLTVDDRKAVSREISELAAEKGGDSVISVETGHSDTTAESVMVTSNGFSGSRMTTAFSAGAGVTVKDGDKGRPSDYAWCTTRLRQDLRSAKDLAHEAVTRAQRAIGQTKGDSAKLTAVIENRVAGRFLGGLIGALNGSRLQQKNSFLEGKLGEAIGSPALTLIDDPHVTKGLGSRLYDAEGMTTQRRPILDSGTLSSYLLSTYYGNKLKMTPTIGSPTNLIMDYGDKTLEEIIAGVEAGILIRSFIGGNSNSATGDFSFGVIGDYIEGGKIVRPVNEMNLSGNYADVFSRLVEIGNDPYIYSSWRLPSLRLDDVQFAGV